MVNTSYPGPNFLILKKESLKAYCDIFILKVG